MNEKIGDFRDISAGGLTGGRGHNTQKERQEPDVRGGNIEGSDGKFAIYPIEHVDEGLEILTGMPVGERDEKGGFPEGSVNRLVEARLGRR
ncbi:MAG: hypothetical protein HS130_08105 [Deltaproteobacteria bacterium]|nr:hypothetical protein [Deltaproteobacteria bacterium]